MLTIQEGHYTFPVYIEEDDDNIEIYVGASRRRLPCIHISIYGTNAVLHDLVFLSHCSTKTHLSKGIVMLKAVLKWLFTKYPLIEHIEFMDKSYYKTDKGRMMLHKMLRTLIALIQEEKKY